MQGDGSTDPISPQADNQTICARYAGLAGGLGRRSRWVRFLDQRTDRHWRIAWEREGRAPAEAVSPVRAGATGCPPVAAAALLREGRTRPAALLREDRSEPAALLREDRPERRRTGGTPGTGGLATGGTAGKGSGGGAGVGSGGAGGAHTGGSSGSGGGAGTGGGSALPWLTVNGNKLQDPTGKTIILRGSALIDIGVAVLVRRPERRRDHGPHGQGGGRRRAGARRPAARLSQDRLQHGRRRHLLPLPLPGRHGPDRQLHAEIAALGR